MIGSTRRTLTTLMKQANGAECLIAARFAPCWPASQADMLVVEKRNISFLPEKGGLPL